jgi:uncharacterized protein (DUF433 family)
MAIEAERIVCDPNILGGKPTVRGTRISVEHVLGMIAEGMGEVAICTSYPRLSREDVRACVTYAMGAVQQAHPSAA